MGPERGSEILCVLTHGMGSTPPPLKTTKWQDSGRANLLSTTGDTSTRQTTIRSRQGDRIVGKLSLQKEYYKFMGRVDHFD